VLERKLLKNLVITTMQFLADEASDVSHKQQLAVYLRYIDKLERPCEHFLRVVHVKATTSLSFKEVI
jgi:hypothetical protein